MRLFDLPQAQHFCKPAGVGGPGQAQSLAGFHASLSGITTLTEGTTSFVVHQANLLSSVERWIAYSISNYRRAIEMLVPVAAPWAQVTLYYSSFFAANAILGMFGGWVGQVRGSTTIVDVEQRTPGSQRLRIHRRQRSPNRAAGSHRAFWDFFYDATPGIVAWAPPTLASALDPVNGDVSWQIGERNNVNYDMHYAWEAATHFHRTFKSSKLESITGPAALQLEATQQMLRLATHFACDVDVSCGSLRGCGVSGDRAHIQRILVRQRPPNLTAQSELASILSL
ncbi:MAG TPA: hypothetical protein VE974_08645 [Thermoanaerobaculia bacterium]|nr:hypothetical protein [Thermoanaerobaculia bacterium]